MDIFNNKSSINIKGADGKRVGSLIQFTKISRAPGLVEKYIEIAENNGKFTLKEIRAKENTLDNFFTMRVFGALDKVGDLEIENLLSAARAIKSMKPSIPEIDKAGAEHVESVIGMSDAFNRLMDYYKTSEEFKLDDFTKSPELHKVITAAYKKYEAASANGKLAHSNLYEQLHAKEIASLKAKGFNSMVVVYESVDYVSDIFDGLVSDYNTNGNLKKSNKTAYEAKLMLIEDTLAALKKAKEEPEMLAKEQLSADELNSYIEALNAYSVSTKIAIRDMGKNKDENLLNDLQNKQLRVIARYSSIVQG